MEERWEAEAVTLEWTKALHQTSYIGEMEESKPGSDDIATVVPSEVVKGLGTLQ